jgi:hypothetical protein
LHTLRFVPYPCLDGALFGDDLEEENVKIKPFVLVVVPLAASMILRPALAGPVMVKFVMPQGSDPNFFTFTADQQIIPVSGQFLLGLEQGGLGGADFRADPMQPLLAFDQLKVTFDWASGASYAPPEVSPPYTGAPYNYNPWAISSTNVMEPGEPIYLTEQGNAPGMGDPDPFVTVAPRFFCHMEVTGIDPADIDAFKNATFDVQAFVHAQNVPEPGTLALAFGMLTMGLGIGLRRRARR